MCLLSVGRGNNKVRVTTSHHHLINCSLTATVQGEVKPGPTPFNTNMEQAAAAVALYANPGR